MVVDVLDAVSENACANAEANGVDAEFLTGDLLGSGGWTFASRR